MSLSNILPIPSKVMLAGEGRVTRSISRGPVVYQKLHGHFAQVTFDLEDSPSK